MDDSDPDTQHIRAFLAHYATPQEIAEEGLRVCRINAGLRREVEELKKEVDELKRGGVKKEEKEVSVMDMRTTEAPAPASTSATTTTTVAAAASQPTSTKALKNKIAVMQDALSEMRREAPKMRECMAWMWEILGDEADYDGYIHVPRDLRDLYHNTMDVDVLDWQPKRGGGGGRTEYRDRGRKDGGKGKNWKGDGKKGDGKKGSGACGGAGEKKQDVKMNKVEIKDKGNNKEKHVTADNVVVGGKRKGTSPLANDNNKKLKIKMEHV